LTTMSLACEWRFASLNHVSGAKQRGEMDETMIETVENDI